ncbi:NAC transcription factor 32-like [Tripterygium wilfordii]|uniref:NAC transcription factor 32-like n=1 Tax=Tripterygium wilfordii TaxID=458696 RepID=UPI0018F80565|nr:NAC transcription factor 32-like [Tripterygium wilfordii]
MEDINWELGEIVNNNHVNGGDGIATATRKVYDQYFFPIICDVKLCEYHPQVLADTFAREREACWYFFSPRNRKYLNGSRPDRAVGENGSWKPTGVNAEIKNPGKDSRNSTDDDPMKLDEWVLCKVYKTRKSKKDKDVDDIN